MAENWTSKYLDNGDINYGASDFETYRASFIALLQKLYPENFNDYIDNSEVIMLISSLAYLGESLNYVIEMDTRDNFPATTERLASLLNFARMINYPVKRNVCASGLAKIVSISTDEELFDSMGNSLRDVPIKWNDISNIYWYEQMMVVLNSVFVSSNPFGLSVDTKTVGAETYNLYSLNVIPQMGVTYPFTATVNGSSMDFELVNPIIQNNALVEHYPDDRNYFNIIFKNDGSGYDSANNGFFVWFKQGVINKKDQSINEKETFKTINLNVQGVNDSDVWVEELNLDGSIKHVWTAVESVNNTSYSKIDPSDKKIYQIITNAYDDITIKFGDGLTGEIPQGNFRIYYRTSNGLTYSINPREMTNISVSIPYHDSSYKSDQVFHLTITFALQEQVNNSIPSLTVADIQDNLPAVSSTQNRMVTAKDYNYFPLYYTNVIKKIIAENRIYSGVIDKMIDDNQSNLIQNVNVIVDDGYIYKGYSTESTSIPLPTLMTSSAIIDTYILPLLSQDAVENFFYDTYPSDKISGNTVKFTVNKEDGSYSVGTISGYSDSSFLAIGSMIKLYQLDGSNHINTTWVSVIDKDDTTLTVNKILTLGTWYVEKVDVPFNRVIDTNTISDMVNVMNNITALNTSGTSITRFGLRYDSVEHSWKMIDGVYLGDGDFNLSTAGQAIDNSWLIRVEWTPTAWVIKWRTIQYTFGSIDTVQFPEIMNQTIINYRSGETSHDFVKFLKINEDLNTGKQFVSDIKLFAISNEYYDDGSLNPYIIDLELPRDATTNDITNPDMVNDIIGPIPSSVETTADNNKFIFFKREESSYGYYEFKYTTDIKVINTMDVDTELTQGVYYVIGGLNNGFIRVDKKGYKVKVDEEYRVYNGRTGLIAQYKHYTTDHIRIDPVPSAFIEMYVLTAQNYKAVMDWKSDTNRSIETFPAYPTNYELMTQFAPLEENKMISDEMIWRPLKYKLLFGKEADEKLRADIKVTKKATSLVADNIIRQRVLLYMEEFFNDSKWFNSKEFNYTELATYIHQRMSGDITNCVIVPLYDGYKFGKLYQIRFEEYEIPLNVATLDNIKVIPYISDDNIKIGR